MRLKPLRDQVVVVLGASSGIGREGALRLAERGAKVVVAARSEEALRSLVQEIAANGGEAAHVVCDVADVAQVQAVAEAAVERFGRVDTWVIVAGVFLHARVEDTDPAEFRRLMEINYLGMVHGALAALPLLRRSGGGALIAISSAESSVAMPRHSAYAASKSAAERFVVSLRLDLAADRVPISVTSIKPIATNTPIFANAAHRLTNQPKAPGPMYRPSVVAGCIVYAAEHPVRDLWVGGAGRVMALGQALAPRLMDPFVARVVPLEHSSAPLRVGQAGTQFSPRPEEDRVEGDFSDRQRGFSVSAWLGTHPPVTAALKAAAVAGLLGAGHLVRRGFAVPPPGSRSPRGRSRGTPSRPQGCDASTATRRRCRRSH